MKTATSTGVQATKYGTVSVRVFSPSPKGTRWDFDYEALLQLRDLRFSKQKRLDIGFGHRLRFPNGSLNRDSVLRRTSRVGTIRGRTLSQHSNPLFPRAIILVFSPPRWAPPHQLY